MGKVLKVDLSTGQFSEYPWSDSERELYLGGKIMAAKIFHDNVHGPIDPFSEENMLVFTTGPLTGSGAPSSSRFNISTISPMTGLLTSSNCGGSFGMHLKRAGYDGLIVTGKSESPVWLEITDKKVAVNDATHLWGLKTTEAQEKMGGKAGGKVVIGPAGENLVQYAGVFSQELLLPLAGPDEFAKTPAAERANRAVAVVKEMNATLKKITGMPTTLKECGVEREQLPDIARLALGDGALVFNPEESDYEDILGILVSAY